jgi:hypothetical protein
MSVGYRSVMSSRKRRAQRGTRSNPVWGVGKISVVSRRRLHECELCPTNHSRYVIRNQPLLLLGSAEIRVFRLNYAISAAPTLIYHFVAVHPYKLPDDFSRMA